MLQKDNFACYDVEEYYANTQGSPEMDLLSVSTEQKEFSDFWSSSTLGKVVLEGRKLRNEKPRSVTERKYDVINIDSAKSPRDCRRRKKYSKKRMTKIYSPRPIVFRSGITVLPCNVHGKQFYQLKRSRKKRKSDCPLRIAELAVPSKRQCLYTWRSKSSILPDYMVERLKQQVLDQTPIVQISDAIYCFKNRKHSPPKRLLKNGKYVQCARNRCNAITKALCAIFGYKIGRYLNKPMAVTLTPRLQRLSNVIADEMFYLLRKNMCMNTNFSQRIICEMAGKVSIWITLILEESTYKLQEDELNDLEQEIGPILDLIDDLIENVLDICVPETFDNIISVDGESNESYEDYEEESLSETSVLEATHAKDETDQMDEHYDEIIEEQTDNIRDEVNDIEETMSISSFFRNEIYGIIQNIIKEFEVDLKEENQLINKPEDGPSLQQEIENDSDQFQDSLELQPTSPSLEDVKDTLDETLKEPIATDDVETDLLEPNVEEQKENNIEIADLNVSEKPLSEVLDDDANKKVKFSDIDLGTKGQLDIHSDTELLDAHTDLENEEVSWNASADNIKKSSIIFAPPNEDLLTDADESWPEKIPSPVLRPSESISRSITSLGKILETDEKIATSSESDDSPKQEDDQIPKYTTESLKPKDEKKQFSDKKGIKKQRESESKEKDVESLPTEKRTPSRDSKTTTRKPSPPKTTEKIAKPKTPEKAKDRQNSRDKNTANKNKKEKKHPNKIENNNMKNSTKIKDKRAKSVGKKQIISPQEGNQIEQLPITKDAISKPQPHWDYRVNEATAPAWLTRKRVESHKDLTFGLNQYEIRKWCKDLEHEFAKFEMWNDWLKCICRDFATMHRCRAYTRVTWRNLKNWVQFKRNVDKNITTWAKLKRRAHHKLNQTIYICVKQSEIRSPKRYSSRCIGKNITKTQSSPHCSTYKKYN